MDNVIGFPNTYPLDSAFHLLNNQGQVSVVQKVDSAIHWINLYPVDNVIGFPNTYPLDSAFHLLSNRGQVPVVQKVDNAIHRISLYPLDSTIGFPNNYSLLDSDLSGPSCSKVG